METITLKKEEAKKLHAEGNESTKKFILEKFGKDLLDEDWLELWENWQKKNKLNIPLPFPNAKTPEEESSNAHHMLIHIVPIERGIDWVPDYDNTSQDKLEPRWYMGSSGFGFSASAYASWHAGTGCGSRLCSPTPQICKRIAIEFTPIYKKKLMYQTK
jgi:hypothetical protein